MKCVLCIVFTFFFLPGYAQNPVSLQNQAKIYREQGMAMQSRGDLDGALAHYRTAVSLNPMFYEAYNDMGVVYESIGEDEKALEMYKNALSLNPEYPSVYTNLALFYEKKGEPEKALYYWEKRYLLSRQEDYWWHQAQERLSQLVNYSALRKRWLKKKYGGFYEDFSERREQENKQKKEKAEAHLEKGMELMDEKEYEQAIEEFRQAMIIRPPDDNLQMNSKIYYLHGQRLKTKEEIISEIQEALASAQANNYDLAVKKLKNALSAIFSIQD